MPVPWLIQVGSQTLENLASFRMRILGPIAFVLFLSLVPGTKAEEDPSPGLPDLADLPVGITSFGAAFHDGAVYVRQRSAVN